MRWTMVDKMTEMDCGLWKYNETQPMKCGLKEMRLNMNNELWTEGNEMQHEQ